MRSARNAASFSRAAASSDTPRATSRAPRSSGSSSASTSGNGRGARRGGALMSWDDLARPVAIEPRHAWTQEGVGGIAHSDPQVVETLDAARFRRSVGVGDALAFGLDEAAVFAAG